MQPIETQLKEAVDRRKAGLAELQQALHCEVDAERRRDGLRRVGAFRPLMAAAALAVLLTGLLLLKTVLDQTSDALPLCPHADVLEDIDRSRFVARPGDDFFKNPEQYDRICYCRPKYSGNLSDLSLDKARN